MSRGPADVLEDELFIFTPSMYAAAALEERGELFEGKAVGTAKEQDIVFLDKDQTIQQVTDPKGHAKRRKAGVTVGKKKLKAVQARVRPAVLHAIDTFLQGDATEAQFRKAMVKVMKPAWRDVFVAGVRSSGIPTSGQQAKHAKWKLQLSPSDEKWFKSAIQHEMRFLNGFIKAVIEGTYVMPLERRTDMYVRALESFYDSARVIGLPALASITWRLGKDDDAVCASCRYMAAWSPWSKKLLPTTPRSGMTICLTNCRDRLLVRRVTPEKVQAIEGRHVYKRSGHIRNLREIKRLGELPARLKKSWPKNAKPL